MKFRIFSETKLIKTEDNRSVLKEDQPPDSLPPCSSSDAYCHQILFISDQIPGVNHPLDPLLTSDSHSESSQIAEKKDCFGNISVGAQSPVSYVTNMDIGGSQSLSTLAFEDESGKTDIPLSSFNDWADSKEANCPPSTGMKIINFSTNDRNSDDDDGACEAVDGGRICWTNGIQIVRTESLIKRENSFEKNSEIRAEKQQTDDNSCVLKKEDSQFAEGICSVGNISEKADSFVANLDTRSSPSLNVHALVDNSGKSAVSPSSFESNEADCFPSVEVINSSTKDGILEDEDCAANVGSGILWSNDIGTAKTELTIKCESSSITFSEIGAEKQTDDNSERSCCSSNGTEIADFFAKDSLDDEDCGDNGDHGDNANCVDNRDRLDNGDQGDNGDRGDDGDHKAIVNDKSFSDVIQDVNSGILQVVKPEVDEDVIGCVESIGTALDNGDIKEEEDNKNVGCIEKQSDIQNAIPNTDGNFLALFIFL